MTGPLQDQSVLVIGRGGGLAQAISLAARDAGAQVVAAGRNQPSLDAAYRSEPGISTETVDLTDDTPARWPAIRGRWRRRAQRPLPSIMIAMCWGSRFGSSR